MTHPSTKIIFLFLSLLYIPGGSVSKKVYQTLNVYYVTNDGEVDGVKASPVLTANGECPGPLIECEEGDTLYIKVINNMEVTELTDIPEGTEAVPEPGITVHWHGIQQQGSPFSDGVEQVTQCTIPYGKSMEYVFTVTQTGTYWWHAHTFYHYTEGLYGPIVIHPKSSYSSEVSSYYKSPPYPSSSTEDGAIPRYREIILILGEWSHLPGAYITAWFLSPLSQGNEPIPDCGILNCRGQYPFHAARDEGYHTTSSPPPVPYFWVTRGETYRFRLISAAAFTVFDFWIARHKLNVIELDGNPIVQRDTNIVDVITIGPAQRYDFLVEMNDEDDDGRFLILALLRKDFYAPGVNINPNVDAVGNYTRGILAYESGYKNQEKILENHPFQYQSVFSDQIIPPKDYLDLEEKEEPTVVFNDAQTSYAGGPAPEPKDGEDYHVINLVLDGTTDENGVTHLRFNNITYEAVDDAPPLLIRVIDGDEIPESYVPFYVRSGRVVRIIIYNTDNGGHPLHHHSEHFWVMGSGLPNAGPYDGSELNFNGPRRDTTGIAPNSWLVLQYLADNPGVWLFHCHIQWHAMGGLSISIIEGKEELQENYEVPEETRKVCKFNGIEV